MHTYAVFGKDRPVFYRCNYPVRHVMTVGTRVLIYCKLGHLIRGRIYESAEKALRIAERLQRLVDR